MTHRSYIFIGLLLYFIGGCRQDDIYSGKKKSFDSLSGALNTMSAVMRQVDTSLLQKALTRYHQYNGFIIQHVNDTLTKPEADALRNFQESGAVLESFHLNRQKLLERASLVNSQLVRLTQDMESKAIPKDELLRMSAVEMGEASKTILSGYHQQRTFFSAIEKFKNSVAGVEQIIRKRNNNELPVVVKDPETF